MSDFIYITFMVDIVMLAVTIHVLIVIISCSLLPSMLIDLIISIVIITLYMDDSTMLDAT